MRMCRWGLSSSLDSAIMLFHFTFCSTCCSLRRRNVNSGDTPKSPQLGTDGANDPEAMNDQTTQNRSDASQPAIITVDNSIDHEGIFPFSPSLGNTRNSSQQRNPFTDGNHEEHDSASGGILGEHNTSSCAINNSKIFTWAPTSWH
jgi:hypothetical protein